MSDYGGASSIGLHTLLDFPKLLPESYRSFWNYFFNDNMILNLSWNTNWFSIVIFAVMTFSIIYLIIKNKIYEKKLNIACIVIFIAIAPLFFGIIEIMAPDVNIHILMACSMILVFPIFFKVLELLPKDAIAKICKGLIILCTVVVSWIYIFQDQASYLSIKAQQDQMIAVSSRVMTQIESMEEYSSDTPILFFGNIHSNEYLGRTFSSLEKSLITSKSWSFVTFLPTVWPDSVESWKDFMFEYAGVNVNVVSTSECIDILTSEEFKNMGNYPNKNSIKMIDGTIVVKFSDTFMHV